MGLLLLCTALLLLAGTREWVSRVKTSTLYSLGCVSRVLLMLLPPPPLAHHGGQRGALRLLTLAPGLALVGVRMPLPTHLLLTSLVACALPMLLTLVVEYAPPRCLLYHGSWRLCDLNLDLRVI